MNTKSEFWNSGFLVVCYCATIIFASAMPAKALNWGVVGGAATQSYSQTIATQDQENAENAEAAAAASEAESSRQLDRLASGLPQLTRMQSLEANANQNYQQVISALPQPGS